MKIKLFHLGLLSVVLLGSYFAYSCYAEYSAKASLRFSTTQTLGDKYQRFLETEGWMQNIIIELPAYPSNTSNETKEELWYLHTLLASRTPSTLNAIESELDFAPADFNLPALTISTLYRPEWRATRAYLEDTQEAFRSIVMKQKVAFDRVRPSYIDPTLTTTITVPEHPSYPSGHASQTWLYALLLSELMPERSEEFFTIAKRIGYHREVAGVHYPSDSTVGRSLAEQYFAVLLMDTRFTTVLQAAKAEWQANADRLLF